MQTLPIRHLCGTTRHENQVSGLLEGLEHSRNSGGKDHQVSLRKAIARPGWRCGRRRRCTQSGTRGYEAFSAKTFSGRSCGGGRQTATARCIGTWRGLRNGWIRRRHAG